MMPSFIDVIDERVIHSQVVVAIIECASRRKKSIYSFPCSS
jgi:hypothetical protein